jgi:hydrogenase nickel incorporation protein HypA/HybF
MHEVALMTEAVRMAVEAARKAQGGQSVETGRLSVLRLRVGTLSGAVPSALEFAWDVVRRGTPAETARLEIEMVPATGWCAQCETEFDCPDFLNECPRCHNPGGELRRGRELEIASVELN